jgi:hypothetical protein
MGEVQPAMVVRRGTPLLLLVGVVALALAPVAAKKDRSSLSRIGRHVAARFDEQHKISRTPGAGSRWPSKCPEFATMPSERTFARLQRGRVPFVVRKASKLFDPNVSKLADPAFLTEHMGDQRVSASMFPRLSEAYRMHKSIYPTNASRWYPEQPPDRELLLYPFRKEMSMREAVERLWGGQDVLGLEQSPFFQEGEQPALPLAFLKRVLQKVPPLFGKLELSSINLWLGSVLGGRGRHTPMHFDDNDNFLLLLGGRKKVLMFSYADSHNLYTKTMLRISADDPDALGPRDDNRPLASEAAAMLRAFDVAEGTAKDTQPEDAEGGGLTDNFSPVNTQRPDAGRFPHFRAAQPLVCTIDAGDMLFMPQLTWHDIQSYGSDPSTHDGVNIALNFWFEADAHFSVLYHSLMSMVREGHAGVTGEEAGARAERGAPQFHRRAGRVWEFEEGELGAKNGDMQPSRTASERRGMALRRARSGGAGISLSESRQAGWDDDFWGSNYQEIPSLFLDGKWNPVAEARASEFQGEGGEGDESSPERGGREQEGEGEQEEEEEEEEEREDGDE